MSFEQLTQTQKVNFGEAFISFISSPDSKNRIDLQYHYHAESGIMYASVRFGRQAQGPPGHAHGGAISAVFDELMGACCWFRGYPSMTAQYTTRYFKPLPLQIDVLFECHIKKIEGDKLSLKAFVIDQQGIRYAESKGLFVKIKDASMQHILNPPPRAGKTDNETLKE